MRAWFQRLKLKCDEPLSKVAFKSNLRRYITAVAGACSAGLGAVRALGGVPIAPASPPHLLRHLARRGLHSSTFRLNFSAFCGIGMHSGVVLGVFRRCQGVARSIKGCSECIFCQKWLRLS